MKNILLTLCLLTIIKIGFSQTNTFPPSGNAGIGTTTPTYKLDLIGSSRVTDGFLNSDNYFEKVLPDVAFTNGVANLAVDLKLGNVPLWGYIEVEITSTYNYQNSVGKLAKIYAVGVNPGGAIYTNESKVSDVVGSIGDNISFGELSYDNTNSTYKIPISHIVSTGNNYTVKVKMFTNASVAKGVFDVITIGNPYNLTALPKNFVSFNGNLGVGTKSPTQKLDVNGTTLLRNGNDGAGFTKDQLLFGWNNSPSYLHSIKTRHHSGLASGNAIDFYTWKQGTDGGGSVGTQHVMTMDGQGFVGIGTTSPNSKLEVDGNTRINGNLSIFNPTNKIVGFDDPVNYYIGHYPVVGTAGLDIHWYGGIRLSDRTGTVMQVTNGNIGIGTTNPSANLDVRGSAIIGENAQSASTALKILGYSDSNSLLELGDGGSVYTKFIRESTNKMKMVTSNYNGSFSFVGNYDFAGSLGIATPTVPTGFKLAIGGDMIAERVVVKLQSNWPDYVFSPSYKRSTLTEVEEFINKNHHLPNIPSAQEVAENGIDVGKMNAKLLEKMEEMTLYMIEQQKEINALREEVKQIKVKK